MEATTRSNRKACDRIELNLRKDTEINGEAFMLATPSRIHQEISIAIAAQLYNFDCTSAPECGNTG